MLKRLCLLALACFSAALVMMPSASLAKSTKSSQTGISSASDCTDKNGVVVSNALGSNSKVGDECIGSDTQDGNGNTVHHNAIFALLGTFIKYLSYLVGTVAVLMIVIAGLQYVISGTSPDNAKMAKERIERAITGLVLFILMYGILSFIVPQTSCPAGSKDDSVTFMQTCQKAP